MSTSEPTIMDYVHRKAREQRIAAIEREAIENAKKALSGKVTLKGPGDDGFIPLDNDRRVYVAALFLGHAVDRTRGLREPA